MSAMHVKGAVDVAPYPCTAAGAARHARKADCAGKSGRNGALSELLGRGQDPQGLSGSGSAYRAGWCVTCLCAGAGDLSFEGNLDDAEHLRQRGGGRIHRAQQGKDAMRRCV